MLVRLKSSSSYGDEAEEASWKAAETEEPAIDAASQPGDITGVPACRRASPRLDADPGRLGLPAAAAGGRSLGVGSWISPSRRAESSGTDG